MMLHQLGILALCGAWLFTAEVLCPARPAVAASLAGLAVLATLITVLRDARHQASPRRFAVFVAGLGVLATLVSAQWLFNLAYWRVASYVDLSWGAGLIAAVLRAIGVPADHDRGLVLAQMGSHLLQLRPGLERWAVYPLGLMLIAGLVSTIMTAPSRRIAAALFTVAACVVYAPLRLITLGLLSGEWEAPWMFWNPWVTLFSLAPLALFLGLTTARPSLAALLEELPGIRGRRMAAGGALALLAAAALTFSVGYEPAGQRKEGRVMFNDLHSGPWEVTIGEFNETSYGERAIYNYIALRQWLEQFYQVTVNTDRRIDDELLADVDVFVLKTPTQPLLDSECDALIGFVERGGGLWLVGDHTNLFGMSTYMNPVAGRFGIRFRFDDTFDLNTGNPSRYKPPRLGRHPVVAQVRDMDFQTSCTLEAPLSARPVIVGSMLGSELVDYGHVNFFGNITVDPQDSFGIYLQAAAVSHGRGRVLAFSDSTVFSNFTMFLPGIPELATGSIEFLNRREDGRMLSAVSGGSGLLALMIGVVLAKPWRYRSGGAGLCVSMVAGSVIGGLGVTAMNARVCHQPPKVELQARAVVDTAISSFRLPSSLDYEVPDAERCFDAFYLNLARLGLRPTMGSGLGDSAAPGTSRIFILPTRKPSAEESAELRRYVEQGGLALIAESSVYISPATRALLSALDVQLAGGGDQPIDVRGAEELAIPADRRPRTPGEVRAYRKTLGRGRIMLIIGAESFSRKNMGQIYKNPDVLEREWYALQYHLFHEFMDEAHDADSK